MTVIYRVETKHGIGPYRDREHWQEKILEEMCDAHCSLSHPAPVFDGIGMIEDDEHCGFDSLDDLINWFGGWGDVLESAEYFVVEYECAPSDYRKGGHQVVFTRDKAVKGDRHMPTDVIFDPLGGV